MWGLSVSPAWFDKSFTALGVVARNANGIIIRVWCKRIWHVSVLFEKALATNFAVGFRDKGRDQGPVSEW